MLEYKHSSLSYKNNATRNVYPFLISFFQFVDNKDDKINPRDKEKELYREKFPKRIFCL